MECRNCPYGKEDFIKRMYWYNKIIAEYGIPNDIYRYLQPKDAPDEFERYLWCDKVGGKTYIMGRCCDADFSKQESVINNNSEWKEKKRNKRERDCKHNNHLKSLYETSRRCFPVIYKDKIFIKGHGYIDNPKPYYKRIYRGSKSHYYKRKSNRKIRRYKGEIPTKGSFCHKIYSRWWEMY